MKYFIAILLLSSPHVRAAESCWPLLEQEAQKIGYEKENWAQDLTLAINWGPQKVNVTGGKDPQKEILEMFKTELSEDCMLSSTSYDQLQNILLQMMDEGAFCPDGKLLPRPVLGRWKKYKSTLLDAVKGGRFQETCQSVAISEDTEIKTDTPFGESKRPEALPR